MPRKKLIQNSDCTYHVTNRSNNKEFFYIPLSEAWQIFCEVLGTSSGLYRTEMYAFVLMSNHYHLLVTAPRLNLHLFMRHFQTEVSRRVQKTSGRINHVFGTRYKWSCLQTSSSYALAYKYVMRNPVKAGICDRVESYAYSSLSMSLPVADRIGQLADQVATDYGDRLSWLNKPTQKETDEVVRRALRRKEFLFPSGNEMRYSVERVASDYEVEI
jgi:putative transposase